MAQNQFRMYPRGFLGDVNNVPVLHMYNASTEVVRALRNADTAPQRFKMLGAPNQALDELHQSLLNAPSNLERFAWREDLLKVALRAFGTDSLAQWLTAQASSPYCGKHHKNFITDCLRFATGQPRHQAISSWNHLISDEDMGAGGAMPTRNDLAMFGSDWLDKASIADLIKAWCSRESGYADLVNSLNILFGRYDGLY